MDNPENIAAYSLKDLIKPNMIVCEIGVRSGQSSEMFLELGCFVNMIDPWEKYEGIDDENYRFEEDYENTLKRIERFKNQYKIFRSKSDEVLNDIPNGSLDLVYIDGNHAYEFVKRDITCWWFKIKEGGYIAGDDWAMENVARGLLEAILVISETNFPLKISYKGRNWIIQKND